MPAFRTHYLLCQWQPTKQWQTFSRMNSLKPKKVKVVFVLCILPKLNRFLNLVHRYHPFLLFCLNYNRLMQEFLLTSCMEILSINIQSAYILWLNNEKYRVYDGKMALKNRMNYFYLPNEVGGHRADTLSLGAECAPQACGGGACLAVNTLYDEMF